MCHLSGYHYPRTIGSSDHRTIGPSDHRTLGPSDHWTHRTMCIGSSDHRIFGSCIPTRSYISQLPYPPSRPPCHPPPPPFEADINIYIFFLFFPSLVTHSFPPTTRCLLSSPGMCHLSGSTIIGLNYRIFPPSDHRTRQPHDLWTDSLPPSPSLSPPPSPSPSSTPRWAPRESWDDKWLRNFGLFLHS